MNLKKYIFIIALSLTVIAETKATNECFEGTSRAIFKFNMAFDNMIGIVKTVIKLAMAVRVTERRIFPLATCVMRLLVGPPGQTDSIIIPIAIAEFKSNNRIIENPIKGRNIS